MRPVAHAGTVARRGGRVKEACLSPSLKRRLGQAVAEATHTPGIAIRGVVAVLEPVAEATQSPWHRDEQRRSCVGSGGLRPEGMTACGNGTASPGESRKARCFPHLVGMGLDERKPSAWRDPPGEPRWSGARVGHSDDPERSLARFPLAGSGRWLGMTDRPVSTSSPLHSPRSAPPPPPSPGSNRRSTSAASHAA